MNDQPPPNKPPGKRGVNKATMDLPQEEFIEQSADTVNSAKTPKPSEATPGGVEEKQSKAPRP